MSEVAYMLANGQGKARANKKGNAKAIQEWRLSFMSTEELTLADARTQAWLRGEEIEARTAHSGWCCVTVDGMPLSGGKVSGGKVKNHLPKALRNLG